MKERPIPCSNEMVGAILEGRKTQTRRIAGFCSRDFYFKCKYGEVGDRLWVRETFCDDGDTCEKIWYKADFPGHLAEDMFSCVRNKWKSPIFMPRIYSRITLEITNIRVERLQDISEEDAFAEGISGGDWLGDPVGEYKRLWERINGSGSWDLNPFVWVIEFRRLR